jgi:hypothetical protein
MPQSDANCSPHSNSLIIRENTGNLRDFDPLEPELQSKKALSSLGFLSRFPTQPNRDYFSSNREYKCSYQGIFFGEQRNRFEGSFDGIKLGGGATALFANPSSG